MWNRKKAGTHQRNTSVLVSLLSIDDPPIKLYFLLNNQYKKGGFRLLFMWCGRQDSNLHALALEPKSNESTNSTTPAYSFCILAWRCQNVNGVHVGKMALFTLLFQPFAIEYKVEEVWNYV